MRVAWLGGSVATLALAACPAAPAPTPASVSAPAPASVSAPPRRCAWAVTPTVVRTEGAAFLHVFELDARPELFRPALPDAPGYHAFRAAITAAGGDLIRPIQDPPQPRDAAEAEVWRREGENTELVYRGDAGQVRPIHCLEALLFAEQDARHSQLTQPTEYIAAILRRSVDSGTRLRIYVAASDVMFPPRAVYPFADVAADVAAGWEAWVMLHNHTVKTRAGRPALGMPAPSTNDVHLARALVADLGLRAIWVTNGMYTVEISADQLAPYRGTVGE